jgi:hypothetical protein
MDRQGGDGDAQTVPGWLVPGSPVPRSPAWGPGVTAAPAPQTPGNRSVWRPKRIRCNVPAQQGRRAWRRQAHPRQPDQRSRRALVASSATSPFPQSNARLWQLVGDRASSPKVHRVVGKPLLGGQVQLLANGQRPLRQPAKRASGEVSLYSGIQTPKKLKPNWLNCGFQKGVSWYPQ